MKMTGSSNTVPKTDRPRILLAENDPGARRSLQLLLQARGLDVRAHASGVTLLADPSVMEAACLVADYQLDELDGLQILARLRARGWVGPAVLITASRSVELKERALTQGFDAVIDKPFPAFALADTIVRLVNDNDASGDSAHAPDPLTPEE